jgi:cupin fold WbuC family metalloprotein
MASFHPVTAAVFETEEDPASVSDIEIAALVEAARRAPQGRARLILHADRMDSLHEMIIALPSESCDHPHINFKSGKSFLALSGQFAVMVFSDDGTEITPVVLSANSQAIGVRMTRLRRPFWHTIIPISGDVVFLETIIGPFEGNQWATWFPGADRAEERAAWASRLRAIAKKAAVHYPHTEVRQPIRQRL